MLFYVAIVTEAGSSGDIHGRCATAETKVVHTCQRLPPVRHVVPALVSITQQEQCMVDDGDDLQFDADNGTVVQTQFQAKSSCSCGIDFDDACYRQFAGCFLCWLTLVFHKETFLHDNLHALPRLCT